MSNPEPKKIGKYELTFRDDSDDVTFERVEHHVKLFVSVDRVEGQRTREDDVEDVWPTITFNYIEQYMESEGGHAYLFMDQDCWDSIIFDELLGYVDGVPDIAVELSAQAIIREYCKSHNISIHGGVR
jgi:hypothetical protein